ncbi:LOW QUALITY PROTEIN: hypothetical protein YC2023_022947 [Brassica napus]
MANLKALTALELSSLVFIQCIRKNKPTKLKRESYKILPRPLAINEADFEIKIPTINSSSRRSLLQLTTTDLCFSGDRRVAAPLAPPPVPGGCCFVELVSGHGLCGGRVASWSCQLPVKLGGSVSSRLSGPCLLWVEVTIGP